MWGTPQRSRCTRTRACSPGTDISPRISATAAAARDCNVDSALGAAPAPTMPRQNTIIRLNFDVQAGNGIMQLARYGWPGSIGGSGAARQHPMARSVTRTDPDRVAAYVVGEGGCQEYVGHGPQGRLAADRAMKNRSIGHLPRVGIGEIHRPAEFAAHPVQEAD